MGNHRLLFEFSNSLDVDQVLKREPRSSNKYLVALKRVLKHIDVRSLVFNKTSFCVQVHNLPIGSFSMVVAKDIASIVGVADEREIDVGDGEGCNFLSLNHCQPINSIMQRLKDWSERRFGELG